MPDLTVVPDAAASDPLSRLALSDDAAALQARFDDWTQALGGVGSFRDRHEGVTFRERKALSQRQLDALYKQNAIAARLVDLIVDDALREGWEFEHVDGVTDLPALRKRIDRELGIDDALREAGKWSRKDGAALLTIPTDAKPMFPLALQRVTRVHRLAVEPRRSVVPLYSDEVIGSPTYRKTLTYQVTSLGGESVDMHRSHCVLFESIALPFETLQETGDSTSYGFGPSVLDRLFDQLSRYGATQSFAVAMLFVASLLVVKFDKYGDDFRKPGGRALLKRKAERMRAQMDALGLLFLDKQDDTSNLTHTMTGIVEILDRVVQALAAAADMPREILLNESPNGLRGGELSGAQELWHRKVRAYQVGTLQPAIEHVLAIAFRAWGMGTPSFRIKWRDLWTPTPAEDAETSSRLAAADQIYYSIGAATESEIREDRFVRGNRGPLHVKAAPKAEPFDLSAPIDEPEDAAVEQLTPADEAMNGAQIASLVTIMQSVNQGLITYTQGIGALGVAFPALRGREATVLGPPPAVAMPVPAPAAVPDVNAPVDPPASNRPEPGDAASPREIAAAYGVPTRTITLMIERGELEYWGLGKHKRVSAAEVQAAAKRHEQQATDPDEGAETGEV